MLFVCVFFISFHVIGLSSVYHFPVVSFLRWTLFWQVKRNTLPIPVWYSHLSYRGRDLYPTQDTRELWFEFKQVNDDREKHATLVFLDDSFLEITRHKHILKPAFSSHQKPNTYLFKSMNVEVSKTVYFLKTSRGHVVRRSERLFCKQRHMK